MNKEEIINTSADEIGTDTEQTTSAKSTTTKLPDGYLADGFMEITSDGKNRFPKCDYVDRYAKELAVMLATGTPAMTAAAFRAAFLRDAKKALRRGTPVGLMLTVAATMQVQAIKLVSQNKAPVVLVDMLTKATSAVTDAETFQALYTHLDAVYAYMLQSQQQKGGEV